MSFRITPRHGAAHVKGNPGTQLADINLDGFNRSIEDRLIELAEPPAAAAMTAARESATIAHQVRVYASDSAQRGPMHASIEVAMAGQQ